MLDSNYDKKLSEFSNQIVNYWPIVIFACYLFGFFLLQFPDIINFGIIDYPLHYYLIFGLISIIVLVLYKQVIETYEKITNKVDNVIHKGKPISSTVNEINELIEIVFIAVMGLFAFKALKLDFYMITTLIVFYTSFIIRILMSLFYFLNKLTLSNYLKRFFLILCFIGFYFAVTSSILNNIKVNFLQRNATIHTEIRTYNNVQVICTNSDYIYFYNESEMPIIMNKDLVNYIK
jgi:hypothetical protein